MSSELTALSTLAVEINLLNEQVEHHKNQAVIYAARTGEKLLLAKAQCKHGEFGNWLKENCTVSPSYANSFMKLATDMPQLLNSHSSVNIGLKQAIALLNAPEEVKTEVTAKIEAGEDVTIKEIQRLKKEAAEAKEMLEKANQNAMQTALKLDDKQDEIAKLKGQNWKLENQQQQIIEAKLNEERAKLVLENQQAIAENKRLADNAIAELERLKREQQKAIKDGVSRELSNLDREIELKQGQVDSYTKRIETLRNTELSLERSVGVLQTHKKCIEKIKDNLSFLTVSFHDAFDTNEIPAEVSGEWDAIFYAISKLKKQMAEWRDQCSPIESEALIGELVD